MSAFDSIPHFLTTGAQGQRVYVVELQPEWLNKDGYLYPLFELISGAGLAPDEIVTGFSFPPSRREEGVARPLPFQYLEGRSNRSSLLIQELDHHKVAEISRNCITIRGRKEGRVGATELVLERWLDQHLTPVWVKRGQMAYQMFDPSPRFTPLDRIDLYGQLYGQVGRRWREEHRNDPADSTPHVERFRAFVQGTFLEHYVGPGGAWDRGQLNFRLSPYLGASALAANEPIIYQYWMSGEAAQDPEALTTTLAHLRTIYAAEEHALPPLQPVEA